MQGTVIAQHTVHTFAGKLLCQQNINTNFHNLSDQLPFFIVLMQKLVI